MRSYIFDKKEKAVFDLLRNCISNDCTRKNLCHSYYDGNGNIYATNGRRLVKISSKRLISTMSKNSIIRTKHNPVASFQFELNHIRFASLRTIEEKTTVDYLPTIFHTDVIFRLI